MASKAITLPFSIGSTGGIDYTYDEIKIWQDRVLAVVMTNLGERVMNPTFGSDIGATVFQNIDEALTMARQSISIAFTRWLRPLTLISVDGTIDPNTNNLNIEVIYKLRSTEQAQSVTIKTAILSRAGEIIVEGGNV